MSQTTHADDPDRQAGARRARGRGGPPRHPVRLGDAGARGRGLRARVRRATSARRTPARSRTARPRCTWRCWPSASAPATRSSPSATRSSPPRTRSATAAPRRSSSISSRTRYNIDPALIEPAITAADQGDPVRPPARHAVRSRRASSRSAGGAACRSSRMRPAPSAARSSGTGAGRRSASRTATSPASPSIRAR